MASITSFAALLALVAQHQPAVEGASREALIEALVGGVTAALAGDAKTAQKTLANAALIAPELRQLDAVIGAQALLAGDDARARRTLASVPEMALYYAMAQSEEPGGLARARDTLASHTQKISADTDTGAIFLAALAFAGAGQEARAQELLAQALERAPSVIDAAFAPDPAVGLAQAAVRALNALGASSKDELRLAEALVEAGRRHAARNIAERVLASAPEHAARARRVIASAIERSEPRRALEELDLVLATETEVARKEEATVKKLELLVATGEVESARKAVLGLAVADAKLRGRVARVRARLMLEKGGDPAIALEAAESAAAEDPKSNGALALLVRALIANGKLDRARAFGEQLLRRKPTEVDAFALLADVAEAKGETSRAATLRLRSEGFRTDKQRIDREARRREDVLRSVREAERGLGVAGLEALRGEEPMLALPLDLAMAKSASTGFKRAAKDRILAACKNELATFLRNRSTWDRARVDISPYGEAVRIDVALSAADPGRCAHPPQRTRKPR